MRYADLLTLCPQWDDIFVKRTLAFTSATPSPRILDCGANVGLASLFFRRLYPDARITAFEADPAVFAMLDANLRANGAGSVEARQVALWTSTGTVTFQCEGSDSGMISSLPGAVAGRAQTVPSLRLRDVLEEGPVDLLKLDIEGAEDIVLADCEPALQGVKAIVMDLHEFDPRVRQAPRVLELLSRAGFSYAIDEFVAVVLARAGDRRRLAVSRPVDAVGDDRPRLETMTDRPSVVYVLPDKMGGSTNIVANLLQYRRPDAFTYHAVLTHNHLHTDRRYGSTLAADTPDDGRVHAADREPARGDAPGGAGDPDAAAASM